MKYFPVLGEAIDVNRRDASMNVSIDILNIFRICGVNIASDVQVIPVFLFNFVVWYKTRILWICSYLLIKRRNDSIDITFTQTILVAVLNVPTTGINHKDALSVCSTLFIDHKHAGSYAGAVKQVCRKADDALNPMFLDNSLSDGSFCVSTEEDSMRQNNRSLAV